MLLKRGMTKASFVLFLSCVSGGAWLFLVLPVRERKCNVMRRASVLLDARERVT